MDRGYIVRHFSTPYHFIVYIINRKKETEIYNSVSGLEYFRPLFHFLRVIYCCIKR